MKENIIQKRNGNSTLDLILYSGVIIDFQNIKSKNKWYNFLLYSKHDSTVAPLAHLLTKSLPHKYPHYVASVIIELRKLKNEYFVRFLYKNNSENEEIKLYPLLIDGKI